MKKSAAAVAGWVVGTLILFALVTALWGATIMLGFGIFWHEFGVGKPIGFWPSLGLGLLLELVLAIFRPKKG